MPISTPVPAAASTGVPAPSAAAGPALLPHERDEIPDAKRSAPQPAMDQAARDLSRGLVDTEARSKAVEVYDGSAEPRKSRKARHPRIDSRRKPDLL